LSCFIRAFTRAVRTTSFRWIPVAVLVAIVRTADAFAQTPDCTPAIIGLDPSTGPAEGGTTVTITGRHFQRCTVIGEIPCPNVSFGGTNAAQVLSCSDTTLVVVTPPHQPGVVALNVPFFNDGPGPTLNNAFTYTGVAVPVSNRSSLFLLAVVLGFLAALRVR
jgi:hypothetical protein